MMQAKLVHDDDITLSVVGTLSATQLQSLRLLVDDMTLEPLTLRKESQDASHTHYTFQRSSPFHLGHRYLLVVEGLALIPIHMGAALSFPNFASLYTYDGDDLGSVYHPTFTSFKVWAPLASDVCLMQYNHAKQLQAITPMMRQNHGVYAVTLAGDHQGLMYRYAITNHGINQTVIDPYGKTSSRNSEFSVVVDLHQFAMPMHDHLVPKLANYQQAIIYEAHVRDLSSDAKTAIPFKGTFLGAIQTGYRSQSGQPIGFDYLVNTGITHLQLLPVNDYRTVDEHHIDQSYNWGYDPYQYFTLEGSYASDPDDPLSRMRDFVTLVSAFHAKGIAITIDVVFNHVYDYQHSVFEKVVPGYYFRQLKNGQLSNGSFCGNDLATEKPMVRKLLVDAATFLVKTYHLDGFRFDLMGILDIGTLEAIKTNARAINPHFMLYGEGWDMPTHLPKHEKGITENSAILKDFAFFNDAFRNLIKGGNFTHDLHEQGYATGNAHVSPHLPGLLLGSSDAQVGPVKVSHPSQSINYVQCHDNHTFYDKLLVSNADEGEAFLFRRIIFANALIVLASGIPFFHAGQELGNSKLGDHNSYRAGDRINQFDYRLIEDRPLLVKAFQDLLTIRKQFMLASQGNGWTPQQLTWETLPHGAYLIHYHLQTHFLVLINPSLHQIQLPAYLTNADYQLIFDGEAITTSPLTLTHLPPVRCLILKHL